jgi:hypothetical protein
MLRAELAGRNRADALDAAARLPEKQYPRVRVDASAERWSLMAVEGCMVRHSEEVR